MLFTLLLANESLQLGFQLIGAGSNGTKHMPGAKISQVTAVFNKKLSGIAESVKALLGIRQKFAPTFLTSAQEFLQLLNLSRNFAGQLLEAIVKQRAAGAAVTK